MNNLSQIEWDKYVNYILTLTNDIDQRFRVFKILLENFDWAFERAEGEAYQKGYQKQIDLRRVQNSYTIQVPNTLCALSSVAANS